MVEHDWMPEARIEAAGCWSDVGHVEVDTRLAEVFARKLAGWIQTAALFSENSDYWRARAEQTPARPSRYPEPPKLVISPDEEKAQTREKIGTLLLSELTRLESHVRFELGKSDSQLGTELAEIMARLRVDVKRWVRGHSPGWGIKETYPPSSAL